MHVPSKMLQVVDLLALPTEAANVSILRNVGCVPLEEQPTLMRVPAKGQVEEMLEIAGMLFVTKIGAKFAMGARG